MATPLNIGSIESRGNAECTIHRARHPAPSTYSGDINGIGVVLLDVKRDDDIILEGAARALRKRKPDENLRPLLLDLNNASHSGNAHASRQQHRGTSHSSSTQPRPPSTASTTSITASSAFVT
jgi:hypothetical protein